MLRNVKIPGTIQVPQEGAYVDLCSLAPLLDGSLVIGPRSKVCAVIGSQIALTTLSPLWLCSAGLHSTPEWSELGASCGSATVARPSFWTVKHAKNTASVRAHQQGPNKVSIP